MLTPQALIAERRQPDQFGEIDNRHPRNIRHRKDVPREPRPPVAQLAVEPGHNPGKHGAVRLAKRLVLLDKARRRRVDVAPKVFNGLPHLEFNAADPYIDLTLLERGAPAQMRRLIRVQRVKITANSHRFRQACFTVVKLEHGHLAERVTRDMVGRHVLALEQVEHHLVERDTFFGGEKAHATRV